MENKKIIIIFAVIIVVLAAAIGASLLNQTSAKQPTEIKITSDSEQYKGGEFSIQLTDLNKTPISKEMVNITVTDSKNEAVVDEAVKTNSSGEAKIDLDLDEGTYNVTVSYLGNENYTGNNTTQKLTIKQEVAETVPEASQTSDSNSNYVEEEIDYNSPDSEYYRWDTDGSYHKKQEGGNYIYSQDPYTGEWSYWANKS